MPRQRRFNCQPHRSQLWAGAGSQGCTPCLGLMQIRTDIRADHCATLERTYQTSLYESKQPYLCVYAALCKRAALLPPGSQLGTEKALCQELGVGKWSLRHALALLRGEGTVQTVVGQGTFVTDSTSPTQT